MSCIPTNPQKEILARGGIKRMLRHGTQNAGQLQFFNGPGAAPGYGGYGLRPKARGLVCVLEHGPKARAVHPSSHPEDLQLSEKEPI